MMSWGELMDGCTVVWLARSIEDPSIPKRNLILNTIETIWSRHFGSRKFTILVCRMPNANQPNAFNANTYSRGWPILSTISSWVWSLPGTALMRSRGVQWALGFDSSHFYKFFFKPRADLDCCFLKPAFSPMIFHKIFTNTSIFDGNIHLTAMSRRTSCWACCGNRIRDGDILKRSLEVSRSIFICCEHKKMWRLVQYEQHKGATGQRQCKCFWWMVPCVWNLCCVVAQGIAVESRKFGPFWMQRSFPPESFATTAWFLAWTRSSR